MKTFTSIQEAFDWWIKNIYPNLPAEEKKGRLTNAWRNYTHKQSMSLEKMIDILKDYEFDIKTIVTYKPQ